MQTLIAAGEGTHKTRTICAAAAAAGAKWNNWVADIIVGGLAGGGGTIILSGGVSPGSTNIGVNPGWGIVTCMSVSATYTFLTRVAGVDARVARTICHLLSMVHWGSKSFGAPINMFKWLHGAFNKVAPYSQLKHKGAVLTPEQVKKIDTM